MAINSVYQPCEQSSRFLHPVDQSLIAMSNRKGRALTRSWLYSMKTDANSTQRGQIDLRIIVGAFVLVIISGPLVAAAIDIHTSLASTPAFSSLSGGVIALLIVAAVVAAALGME